MRYLRRAVKPGFLLDRIAFWRKLYLVTRGAVRRKIMYVL
jgi:hypothetical protein